MNKSKVPSKVPMVRMTKTARMRLLNSNPIIKCEALKTNDTKLIQNLDLDTVSQVKKCILDKIDKPISRREIDKPISKRDIDKQPISRRENEKTLLKRRQKIDNCHNNKNKLPVKKTSQKLRRSLSAPDCSETYNNNPSLEDPLNTSSLENISKIEPAKRRNQIFESSHHQRKSLAHQRKLWSTPNAPIDLRRRLSEWLVKKNKNYSSFKHLKCFGVQRISIINEENKENVDTSHLDDNDEQHGSYENLKIDCPRNEKPLIFSSGELKRITKEALSDLHSLISEGYPRDQCEAWLSIIRQKCPEVTKEPQYWECRAVLDHYKGDIGSAIECYKTAVVQGAEVSTVEQSLDNLLEKFKVLNIDSSRSNRQIEKMSNDLRNVVKSMVIKFAIQEKAFKKSSHMQSNGISSTSAGVLVTPVRRSTRLNRSGFTITPGLTLCSSLQEIEPNIREKMTFQSNPAL